MEAKPLCHRVEGVSATIECELDPIFSDVPRSLFLLPAEYLRSLQAYHATSLLMFFYSIVMHLFPA